MPSKTPPAAVDWLHSISRKVATLTDLKVVLNSLYVKHQYQSMWGAHRKQRVLRGKGIKAAKKNPRISKTIVVRNEKPPLNTVRISRTGRIIKEKKVDDIGYVPVKSPSTRDEQVSIVSNLEGEVYRREYRRNGVFNTSRRKRKLELLWRHEICGGRRWRQHEQVCEVMYSSTSTMSPPVSSHFLLRNLRKDFPGPHPDLVPMLTKERYAAP
jgi:hypothetical protein